MYTEKKHQSFWLLRLETHTHIHKYHIWKILKLHFPIPCKRIYRLCHTIIIIIIIRDFNPYANIRFNFKCHENRLFCKVIHTCIEIGTCIHTHTHTAHPCLFSSLTPVPSQNMPSHFTMYFVATYYVCMRCVCVCVCISVWYHLHTKIMLFFN